jgi:hypothetical protein
MGAVFDRGSGLYSEDRGGRFKRFSDFMSEHLMKAPEVANIRSSVVLESIKETAAYPLQDKPPR